MNCPLIEKATLSSFLILPVQRIPRYDLMKNTPSQHPDFIKLEDSLIQMKLVADSINLAMVSAERARKFIEIQKYFDDIDIMQPHRTFVKQGVVLKQCRKERQKRYDILIYGKKNTQDPIAQTKIEVSGQLSLLQMFVIDVPDNGTIENAFQIQGVGKSFLAFADNATEKAEWMQLLNTAIVEESARAANLSTEVRKTPEALGVAPVWIPDELYKNCPQCDSPFTVIFRRHHCRKCGTVVCGDCSKQKLLVPIVKVNKKVRVCDRCYSFDCPDAMEEKMNKKALKENKEKKDKQGWTMRKVTSNDRLTKP